MARVIRCGAAPVTIAINQNDENVKVSNPQGKGLVPVLEHWQSAQPAQVCAKPAAELLADFCVSSLVLSAEFAFRPVVGQSYHLYWAAERWLLSLIGPLEWGERRPGEYAGCCQLRSDMTWQLLPPEDLGDGDAVVLALARFFDAFAESLGRAESLDESLPGYVAHLPYYQRMLATGLTASMSRSANASGLEHQSGRSLLAAAGANPLLAGACHGD